MRIWSIILALVAVLLLLAVLWPSFPLLKSAPVGTLVALAVGLLLADRAFFIYRGKY